MIVIMVMTMTTTYMMLILVTRTTTSPDQDDDADYYDVDDDDDDDDDQEGPPRPPASYKPCWPSLHGPQGGKTFLEIEIFISVTNIYMLWVFHAIIIVTAFQA